MSFSKLMEMEGGSENFCWKRDGCLEMGGCHITLRFFWRFLMMQHRKKILMRLSFLCSQKCATKYLLK